MLIKATSELMRNQKHATLFSPQSRPVVIQDTGGRSIFFSISDDGILYLTREVSGSFTGWTDKQDLTSRLASNHNNIKVTAKSFAISQNAETLTFDIALVLTAKDSDYVYISLDHAADAWDLGVEWRSMPFDADSPDPAQKHTIATIYAMDIPLKQETSSHNIFVDVSRGSGNGEFLDRYYIRPTSSPRWKLPGLGIDLLAGSIISSLGKVEKDPVPGIYTFGRFNENEEELMFAPQYDAFDPNGKPPIRLFQVPEKSYAIASSLSTGGLSTLFLAAVSGLWVYTTSNQKNNAAPKLVVPSSIDILDNIFAGITQMSASTVGNQTVVWCVNAQKALFYVSCQQGSERDSTAWSVPIPIVAKVNNFASYINKTSSSNVLFVNASQGLIRLTQDPVTGLWGEHRIVLPAPDIQTIYEIDSFTSHIEVFRNDGAPAIDANLSIRASSQTFAFINGTQYSLDPEIPIKVSAGSDGTITVIQETTNLAAVCFEVKTLDEVSSIVVDPASKATQRLNAVGSGQNLRDVKIADEWGNERLLVPSDVPKGNSDAAASSFSKLLTVKKELPQDGRRQSKPITPEAGTPSSFGVDYSTDDHVYFEGDAPPEKYGPGRERSKVGAAMPRFTESGLDYIKTNLGNPVQWLGDSWESVKGFAGTLVNGFWHILVEIAGEVWGAVLDCIGAVSDAIEFVFNKIKVAFEEFVPWLGALFSWKDIVRTHKVIKNIVRQHANMLVDSFSSMEKSISDAFGEAEHQISTWAGLTGPQTTIGDTTVRGDGVPDSNNPQSHWAISHTKNGIESAEIKADIPSVVGDDIQIIVDGLEKIIDDEKDNLKEALLRVKNEIAGQFTSLTAIQIVQRLTGIAGLLIAEAAETAIIGILDIARLLVQTAVNLLNSPIDIPIISPIYKKFTEEDLTILDLTCLVGAIPATVIYKATTGIAPFADDRTTNSSSTPQASPKSSKSSAESPPNPPLSLLNRRKTRPASSEPSPTCDSTKRFSPRSTSHPASTPSSTPSPTCRNSASKRRPKTSTCSPYPRTTCKSSPIFPATSAPPASGPSSTRHGPSSPPRTLSSAT
jgi:hypothetical protein